MRLLDLARARIRAGEMSERSLAKLSGLSQPHMHNVLSGSRSLSTNSADALMKALGLQAADLLWRAAGEREAGVKPVPLMKNRIGPGTESSLSSIRGHILLPESLLQSLVEPVVARVGPDLVLPKGLTAHDLILLNQDERLRAAPAGDRTLWVVSGSSGLRIRYLQMDEKRLYVMDELTLDNPARWLSMPLRGLNILDTVKARLVWMSREMGSD